MSHDRAWSGLGICIVGQVPLIPMRLEQSLATALPADETRIESFESYSDAFDFCRESASIGLIVLLENQGSTTVEQVFSQLAKHYEQRGLPCLGVMVHTHPEASRVYVSDRRIFAQFNLTDFRNLVTTGGTIRQIWDGYTETFQQLIVPPPLQESITAAATDSWSLQSLIFYERAINLLSANLNVSWIDLVAARLYLSIVGAAVHHDVVLKPHEMLRQIVGTVAPDSALIGKPLDAQCKDKATLAKRLVAVATTLTTIFQHSGPSSLADMMAALPAKAVVGAPALLKQLTQCRERLVEFANEGAPHSSLGQKVG